MTQNKTLKLNIQDLSSLTGMTPADELKQMNIDRQTAQAMLMDKALITFEDQKRCMVKNADTLISGFTFICGSILCGSKTCNKSTP